MDKLLDDSEKAKVVEFYNTIKNECSDVLAHYKKYEIDRINLLDVFLRRTTTVKTFTTFNNRPREQVKGSVDKLYAYTNYVLPYLKGAIDRRSTYYMTYGVMNNDMDNVFGSNVYVLFPVNDTKFNMLREDFNASQLTHLIKDIFVDVIKCFNSYSIDDVGYGIPHILVGMPLAYYKLLDKIETRDEKEKNMISEKKVFFYDIMQTYNINAKTAGFFDLYYYLEKNCESLNDIEKFGDIIVSVYDHCNNVFFKLLDDLENSTSESIKELIKDMMSLKDNITNGNMLLKKKILEFYATKITICSTKNIPSQYVMEEVYSHGKSYGINLKSKEFDYLLELINND